MQALKAQERSSAPEAMASGVGSASADSTTVYLSAIGAAPLLTAEEEIHFTRAWRNGDPSGRHRTGTPKKPANP